MLQHQSWAGFFGLGFISWFGGRVKKGVYYINCENSKVIILSNVQNHEGVFDREKMFFFADKKLAIVTWEDSLGVFKRTKIEEKDFKHFIYLGEL